jgi:hypothetical protein
MDGCMEDMVDKYTDGLIKWSMHGGTVRGSVKDDEMALGSAREEGK